MTQSVGIQDIPLLTAVTAASGTGTSAPIRIQGREQLTIYFQSTGTTSGGTLLIEEAYYDGDKDPVYAGTWSQIASVAASSFTGTAQVAYHVAATRYKYVRVRISSDITGGGTVTVVACIG